MWMGHEFFGEKITFPSTLVPGIDNDQSLSLFPEVPQHSEKSVCRTEANQGWEIDLLSSQGHEY